MNQTPPAPPGKSPGVPPPSPQVSHSIWHRVNEDLHKRPKTYLNAVLLVSVLALVTVLGLKLWRGKKADSEGALATTWFEIWGPDTGAKARATSLEDLGPQLTDDAERARRLYELAVTYKEIAQSAETQAEKIGAYEKALGYSAELKSKYPNTLWVKMP